MSDEVKVYVYDAVYDAPYECEWGDIPYSAIGDMLAYSEKHAHMIPRQQYERWVAVRSAMDQVQEECKALRATRFEQERAERVDRMNKGLPW